jgi:protein-S-isoprenylcysteine O-methyltransferase Ste14
MVRLVSVVQKTNSLGQERLRNMINILKTAVFAALFIAFFLIYVPLRWLLPPGTGRLMPLGLIGIIPLAVGFAIVLWCLWEFATRGQGTAAPFDPPKKLVVRGPFKYVRNPIYIGAEFILVGLGILYGSLAILAYAVGCALVLHALVILYEERTLGEKFGDDYAQYKQSVSRWMPRLR